MRGKRVRVTTLPKKYEGQLPDFRVRVGRNTIGHIEAKDFQKYPEDTDLDRIEDGDQLKKYRKIFPNLILTNFFEFRLYKKGILVEKIQLERPFIAYKLKIAPSPSTENQKKLLSLLREFFAFSTPETKTAKQLAIELADRTSFLKEKILEEIRKKNPDITGFFRAFKKHLIATLTEERFADIYAQTITYGLFVARTRANQEGFGRDVAVKFIPRTIPLLKKVFAFISSTELPESMEWIVDEISQVLTATNVSKIIRDFYKKRKGKDPVIHFYETFLAEYDPKERERRGVYYTPEPVVSYIVRSIHKILKNKFDKKDGFATSSVTVLDPAAGTLTFPAEAIRLIRKEIEKKYGSGVWQSVVKDHILKNFYAFELLMAPYAIGHLKITLLLEELGYKMKEDDRFKFYLTNTLEMRKLAHSPLPLVSELSKESEDALEVKEKIPIMVIMGNPPYSGISENRGKWILDQIKEYKQIEGETLGERNPKWLQDDYVKFFRFAQWKIEKMKVGILGFITNHAWLDNPTFRGMRYSLMKTFDEIYILNLHGSTLKKEKVPEQVQKELKIGDKDENVFDIQPGVAITICIKHKESMDKKIFYADRWGLRDKKYKFLEAHVVDNTDWQTIKPKYPYYFFVPKTEKGWGKYERFLKATDIFLVNSVGVVTARDDFVIDFMRQSLETRIRIFRNSKDDEFIKQAYNLSDKPTFKWHVSEARKGLRRLENWEDYFTKILYRPFDERWIYYHPLVIERPREKVMKHLLRPNLALCLTKRHPTDDLYSDVFVSNQLTEGHLLSGSLGITYVFPLYLYNEKEIQQTIFTSQEKLDIVDTQHSLGPKRDKGFNINQRLLNLLQKVFNRRVEAEEIFYYIYGILYSSFYRQRYQEFLKVDFPRIPFTKDVKIFEKISESGKKLANLHLLKDSILNNPITKFYGDDSNQVKNRNYDEGKKRVYINKKQYFEPIEKEAWEYMIGGYQVLDKWLKDRSIKKLNRGLNPDEIKHYCKVATAIKKTIEIQKEIDKIYSKVEKNLIKF